MRSIRVSESRSVMLSQLNCQDQSPLHTSPGMGTVVVAGCDPGICNLRGVTAATRLGTRAFTTPLPASHIAYRLRIHNTYILPN